MIVLDRDITLAAATPNAIAKTTIAAKLP